jgi:hypothetical protein
VHIQGIREVRKHTGIQSGKSREKLSIRSGCIRNDDDYYYYIIYIRDKLFLDVVDILNYFSTL